MANNSDKKDIELKEQPGDDAGLTFWGHLEVLRWSLVRVAVVVLVAMIGWFIVMPDIFKNSMTMFMSEVLYRVVKDGTFEEGLFEWCEKTILLLEAIQSDFSNYHIRFLLELSVALGFSPESRDLKPFVGEHYQIVESFMQSSLAEAMLIPLNGTIRNEIAEEVLRYIEFHTESTLNINSLRVLRELFAHSSP